MRRIALVLTFFMLSTICGVGYSAILPNQALIILKTNDFPSMESTVTTLDYMGAHAQHVLSNKILIAEVPPSVENSVRALYNVNKFFRTSQSTSSYSGEDLTCITAWNAIFSPNTEGLDQQGTFYDDVVQPPAHSPAPPALQSTSNYAPGFFDTSKYMIGKIAVGVVIPESVGGTENWTPGRLNTVFGHVVRGLNWWIGNYPGTVKATKPTFYYDKRFSVPCQYEPISCANQDMWVTDTMSNMGYPSGDMYRYVNDLRNQYHTDWAYVAYIADSANDADGWFAYNAHAYASIGGPYTVLNWKNDGWGINNFYRVFAHETGHVFGCQDEYGTCGTYPCGFLNVPNLNCEYNNPSAIPCIMRGNTVVSNPCQYSVGQIGWLDSDSDGIPDPVDTPVTVTVNSQSAIAENGTLTITGKAENQPFQSLYAGTLTINKITAVKYRVDDGYWVSASPTDGSWNQLEEEFTLTTQALDDKPHHIDIQAFSSSSNTSEIITRIVDRTPPIIEKVTDEGNFGYDETRLAVDVDAKDSESDVTEFMYAIGTTPTDPGSNYVKDWTSAGANSHIVASNLALTEGNTYYFYVKAKNSSSYWSDVAITDGIKLSTVNIAEAKQLPDGTWVALHDKVVTQGSRLYYQYIQEPDCYAGIKVDDFNTLDLGQVVTARGYLRNIDGEFQLVTENPMSRGALVNPLKPLFLTNKAIGGGQLGGQDALWEWRWIKKEAAYRLLPTYGLNNVGTLVKTNGKLTFYQPGESFAYIDDGSYLNDGNSLGENGTTIIGLRVSLPEKIELPPLGTNLALTGISSSAKQADKPVRLLSLRTQEDVSIAGKAMITGTVYAEGVTTVNVNIDSPHPLVEGQFSQYWGMEEIPSMTMVRYHIVKLQIATGFVKFYYDFGRNHSIIEAPVAIEDTWSEWVNTNGTGVHLWTADEPNNSYGLTIDKYEYQNPKTPMAGATVVLNPGNRTAVTDAQGKFVFDNLEPGTYTISPAIDGATINPPSATVTIEHEGQFKTGTEFTKD